MSQPSPDTLSRDFEEMGRYLRMVHSIMGGAETMRAGREEFLPRYKNESDVNYDLRCKYAKFTNVFRDIVENLAQRPFSKEVTLLGSPSPDIEGFVEDVDTRGNSLHTFAGEVFFWGIASGVDFILVDYTRGVPPGASVAEERAIGARPFWVRYPATSVLAVYSDRIEGKEQFTHVRLLEHGSVREGWTEKEVRRIRVLDRAPLGGGRYALPTFAVWEETRNAQTGRLEWTVVEEGTLSIGVIPLVPFLTGRRLKGWTYEPPMRDAAELQVELFQQESALKHAKTMTAFPMLAGNGVSPMRGEDGKPMPVQVGPHTVLYAPPSDGGSSGSWTFIEPGAQSLNFLASDIQATIQQLRELGRQPLTAQSGNLTVVTTAFAAQKGNAAIQAWAYNLSGALGLALEYTAMWLKTEVGADTKVFVNTDFELGFGDDDSFAHVLTLRSTGEVSREATIHEAKRRNILDGDYDPDEDLERILEEVEDEPDLPDPQPLVTPDGEDLEDDDEEPLIPGDREEG